MQRFGRGPDGEFVELLQCVGGLNTLVRTPNEADALFDALLIYRAERAMPLPSDEPELITGESSL